jgi:hypothetical protein
MEKALLGTVKLLSNLPFDRIEELPKPHEFQNIYVQLCIMKYLLNIGALGNYLTSKLKIIFEKYPNTSSY